MSVGRATIEKRQDVTLRTVHINTAIMSWKKTLALSIASQGRLSEERVPP